MRKWLRRGAVGVVIVLLAAGAWTATHWSEARARYASHRLQTAADDDERAFWADALASRGDEGIGRLLECIRASEPASRSAAITALDRHLQSLPENDSHANRLAEQLLELFTNGDAERREALADLLPIIVDICGTLHREKCREAVNQALALPSAAARMAAIRAAMHPDVDLRAAIIPLLDSREAEVRRAALFAVGPATNAAAVIDDEELFRWLHDPDRDVRTLCRDALISRGRTETEIGLGRKLADPEPSERLKLLLDLRYDEVSDPEPWLERLSRDVDPGVRAGAARVMMELAAARHWPVPSWVAKLHETDPNATVRRIAGYYRSAYQSKSEGAVRPAGGPD